MLSGGLDSSCVLAAILATRGARPSDVQLTLDFDARHSDQPFIRAVEAHYGISVVRVPPRSAPTDDAIILDSAPSRHPTDPLDFAAARMARERGADLLVSGVGGDQLFGGYFAPATIMALHERNFHGAWNAFRAMLPYPLSVRARLRKTTLWFLRRYIPAFVLDLRARRAVADLPEWVGPRLRDERVKSFREYAARPAARTSQELFDELCVSPHESEYDAELRAQNEFAFGIPRVDPLYDEELVRFLLGVRHHALFADASYRGLLRRAMRGFLPESVRTRTTKSQFEPGLAESIGPLERFEPLLSFECLERAGIVRPAAFRRFLEPVFTRPTSDESGPIWLACWSALTTEAFLRARV
jgi:asparagine synthase (glutamine-hydrolysing)